MTENDPRHKSGTRERLMNAAVDLMAEHGYKGASTKDIAAAAGVSEMTLFRQFGSKLNMLEEAVDRYYYTVEFRKLFAERIVWELERDLRLIGETYHELMERNSRILLIFQSESRSIPSLAERIRKHPRALQEMLTGYLEAMKEKGKLADVDPATNAASYLWLHHGAFLSRMPGGPNLLADLPIADFIDNGAKLFARALSPR
ncbi:transcriptional regulator, TetR family [Paenibacillus sp. UNC496MF]|uniref:TetR/AcrR family transcriptional regulator n=1 Tax=Paenibacillus sp. UNC496MF TaxID=1502753 RepID=UPI0008F38DC2|nr:TetR/AcrR family transcriptional regulator [Paenibacillus sp. UNC496MF]SFI49448.1 transcriptional regulator, TetR family [Paenibacillus sp. UNC496MF]